MAFSAPSLKGRALRLLSQREHSRPELERKLAKLLPGLDTRAEYAWAGSFGSSPSGAPSIGAIPGMPGCHAVLGYGGNGITFAMAAAQLLRASITGGRDADADLFSFRRHWPGA